MLRSKVVVAERTARPHLDLHLDIAVLVDSLIADWLGIVRKVSFLKLGLRHAADRRRMLALICRDVTFLKASGKAAVEVVISVITERAGNTPGRGQDLFMR